MVHLILCESAFFQDKEDIFIEFSKGYEAQGDSRILSLKIENIQFLKQF